MKIKVVKDFSNGVRTKLNAGLEIEITPNTANYFVGLNGSGKTITMSTLASFLSKQTKNTLNWMISPPEHIMECFNFEGFEEVKDVYIVTAKSRQSQWVDLDIALKTPMGPFVLHASEGMANQAELVNIWDRRNEKDTVFIFDEIDGTLDVKSKSLFFNKMIPSIKGTVIVMSHDVFFLLNQDKVFDFTDKKYKSALKYSIENR